MKIPRLYTLIALITLGACQMNEVIHSPHSQEGLYAQMEEIASTKTYIDDGNAVVWAEGDQIAVFSRSASVLKYEIDDEYIGKNHGRFHPVGSIASSDDLKDIVAYYPYSESIECQYDGNGYRITGVSLPAEQKYAAGSFSQGSFPMIATGDGMQIRFRNICGALKLKLKGSQVITSIKVSGKNDEKLGGDGVVFTDSSGPAISWTDNTVTSMELVCPEGVELNEDIATEFIISLPPTVFSKGFTVSIKDIDSQTYILETDKKNTVFRSSLLVMPEKDLDSSVRFSLWDGGTPATSTLTQDPSANDTYIIDEAADIAWLGIKDNAASLGEGKTLVFTTNIDMGRQSGMRFLQLPAGTSIKGQGHIIKGLRLTSGIFSDATELSVNDLIIDDAEVTHTDASKPHCGILADVLSGSSSLRNVKIMNSRVSSDAGSAGGFVGYINRKSQNSRAERLDVTFDNCHVINTEISAGSHEGHFVGMLRGYDNGEILTFMENCSVSPVTGAAPLESYIRDEMKAAWLADKDFRRYDGWLGAEECYRAVVYFGTERFICKWDGVQAVTPLLADPKYDDCEHYKVEAGSNRFVIYSAFDLAGAREVSETLNALYFRENVDMNGQGKDGRYYVPEEFSESRCESEDDNNFKPFDFIHHIDGQGHTIYNLSLTSRMLPESEHTSAFVRHANLNIVTVHKNLNFRGCCSIAPVVTKEELGKQQDLSCAAIMIWITGPESTGEPTYTMDNIHIYDSYVFGLQHSGILAGIVSRANVYNCSVNNSRVENYKCQNSLEPFEKSVEMLGTQITISADFYSYGEVGGLVGMVRRTSNISNCHVRGCTIHAYGNEDKMADMTSNNIFGMGVIGLAQSMGFYKVPGRHVSTLIGSIRTRNEEIITINGCTVDAATKCTAEQYQHNSSFPFIGQAYYIQFADNKGQVIVDGTSLTLADGNTNTKR